MFKIKNQIMFYIIFIINIQASNANPLVEDEWLKDKVCTESFKIIEVHRSKKEYELSHIPCSVFTNFYSSGWRETRNKIPLLMPSINNLEKLLGSLGILNSDHETETGFSLPKVSSYKARVNQNIIANKDDVLNLINKTGYLIDSRPSDMFFGINTSFPALRTGTIPNAINLPNAWLLENNTLYFQKKENIKKILEHSGITKKDGQISFCNAGLESALSWFVMSEILEYPNHLLYEASLAEWSGDISLPMIDKINISKNKDSEKITDSFSMKPPK